MTYQFDTDLATEYGVDEAIMITNLAFWIRKNEANGKHFHDGRFWTYNSAEAFTKLFPFWSSGQIRRILTSLKDKGVLLTGNYNQSQYDRTTWYAFSDSICQKLQLHLLKSTNGSAEIQNCNNIGADNNTNNKPDGIPTEGGLFPEGEVEVKQREKLRGTSDSRYCDFKNSRWFDFDKFEAEIKKDEKYAGADIRFYYERIKNWSAAGGKKKKDWIAFTKNWMLSDFQDGKLRKAGAISQKDAEYLEQIKEMANL